MVWKSTGLSLCVGTRNSASAAAGQRRRRDYVGLPCTVPDSSHQIGEVESIHRNPRDISQTLKLPNSGSLKENQGIDTLLLFNYAYDIIGRAIYVYIPGYTHCSSCGNQSKMHREANKTT